MNAKFNIKSKFPTLVKTGVSLSNFSLYMAGLELGPKYQRLSDDMNTGELEWSYALIEEGDGFNQYVVRVSGEITIEDCSDADCKLLKAKNSNEGRMILEIKENGDSDPIDYQLQAPGKLEISSIEFD